jgi:hypothetical protein
MDVAALAVAVVTLIALLVSMRYRGQDMSAKTLTDALEPINKALLRHDKDHEYHYKHASDKDSHWTGRERQDLGKRMDNQDRMLEKIDEKITSLMERMYDK